MIVSFSGIDGAGKTTQICALQNWLAEIGLTSRLVTFWDELVVARRLRERLSYAAFKGDKGVGTLEKPLNRRDKNVKFWPLNLARFCLYVADALNARRKIASIADAGFDVVIIDRYIYDELANLPLNRRLTRVLIQALLKIARQPDAAFLIDADPAAARARKPEYPLDFLLRNRETYLALAHLTGHFNIIEPLPIEEAHARIKEALIERFSGPPTETYRFLALQ